MAANGLGPKPLNALTSHPASTPVMLLSTVSVPVLLLATPATLETTTE